MTTLTFRFIARAPRFLSRFTSRVSRLAFSASLLVLFLAPELFSAGKALPPRRAIDLNGEWQVAQGSFESIPQEFTHTVPVPGLLDMATPPSGAGFWYLVRGRNACGSGSYGQQSDSVERTTEVCP